MVIKMKGQGGTKSHLIRFVHVSICESVYVSFDQFSPTYNLSPMGIFEFKHHVEIDLIKEKQCL